MITLRTLLPVLLAGALALPNLVSGQVPQLISYQGRVAVGATNFQGSGAFKFAVVNAAGNVTYWSNDGTSTAGSQPTAAVALTVNGGLYSVLLGDTALANMLALPASVFGNPDVRLRVWFNDGTNGSQLLTPDQRIVPVGYAMVAGGVPDGAISGSMIANGAVGSTQLGAGAVQSGNLAAGSVTGTQIATGAVGATQIATGAVGSSQLSAGAAAANLASSGQSAVSAGGIVLSATDPNAALVGAGYVKIGATLLAGEAWNSRAPAPINVRSGHASVWTGAEMLVWGGSNSTLGTFNDGARYNPSLNNWMLLSPTGAPEARAGLTVVWSGSEMIIWGGISSTNFNYLNDGARYRPTSNTWAPVTATGAPAGRSSATAVWTGTEMIIWGGDDFSNQYADGGRYNPTSNTWTATNTTGAPTGRRFHTAVWTGSLMVVWGGTASGGGRYNPAGNSWTPVSSAFEPPTRTGHTAVWTGTEMIVWGGGSANDGGRYNPTANTWAGLGAGAPTKRSGHTAVWTGSEMIIWGGIDNTLHYNDGARYRPAANTWSPVSISGAPFVRTGHTSVWTGSEMLVWGGKNGSTTFYNDTHSYDPGTTMYLYQRP